MVLFKYTKLRTKKKDLYYDVYPISDTGIKKSFKKEVDENFISFFFVSKNTIFYVILFKY